MFFLFAFVPEVCMGQSWTKSLEGSTFKAKAQFYGVVFICKGAVFTENVS